MSDRVSGNIVDAAAASVVDDVTRFRVPRNADLCVAPTDSARGRIARTQSLSSTTASAMAINVSVLGTIEEMGYAPFAFI